MRGINLDLITPLCAHLSQRHLRVLQKHWVLDITKADRDSRSICHGVGADAQEVRREHACGSAEHKLECVLCVNLETRELAGSVGQRQRDRSELLAVAINIQRTKLGSCKLQSGPFKSNGSLGNVSQLEEYERCSLKSCPKPTWQARTSSFGGSGDFVPYMLRMSFCNAQNSDSLFFSSTPFR